MWRRLRLTRCSRNCHPRAGGLPEVEGVELRIEVGDAFNCVSTLLRGSKEGRKDKPDTESQARTVKAVFDFAEASKRFQSDALRGQPINGSGNEATTGLNDALSSFSGRSPL